MVGATRGQVKDMVLKNCLSACSAVVIELVTLCWPVIAGV